MAQVPATDVTSISVGGSAYTIPFPYQKQTEVFVEVDGVATAFTWINSGNISIVPAPAAGAEVRRYRSTVATSIRHDFRNGVPFTPKNIAENNDQILYVMQEAVNDTAGTAAEALSVAGEARDVAQEALDTVDAALVDNASTLRADLLAADGSGRVGFQSRSVYARLNDDTYGTDYGMLMKGATGTASAEATALLAAINASTKPIRLVGAALRATFTNTADANTFLDNIHRIHVDAGQVSASGAELSDVRIDLPAGKISRTKRVRIRGAQHPQLQLRGAARIPLTFVSATRTWVSATETTWNVTFADASAVSVGDYINCTDLTGTRVAPYTGFWPVTNVVGNVVTMQVSIRANAFTATFTGGTFEKVPTIIEFDNSLGLQISGDWMGSSNNDAGLIDIGIVAINQGTSQNGIYMERDAKLSGLRVCIHGFGSHNYYGLPGSSFECMGFASSGSAGHGAYLLSGAYFGVGSSVAGLKAATTGNTLYGIAASVGSVVTATGLVSSGNGTAGLVVDDNTTFIGNNMVLEANGLNGTGSVGGGITALGDSVLSIEGTSSRFNFAHSIRLGEGAQANLGAGTFNSSPSGVDVIVDDTYSFYTVSGATLGTVQNPFVRAMRRASIAHNFGSVPANSEVAGPTVSITGIANAMNAIVNANVVTAGIQFVARVTAADTVTVYAQNITTSPISVSNRTFYVLGFLG